MRLIDANDYRERRCRTCINRVQCDNGGNLCFDIMVLNTCPTIETQPVKHGRWMYPFYCSECGFTPYYSSDLTYNYCPNCGVRMEG